MYVQQQLPGPETIRLRLISPGQVEIDALTLQAVAQRAPAGRHPYHAGVFALRVDDLARRRFHANLQALKCLRGQLPSGTGIGSALEMDAMTFLPVGELERALNATPRGEVDVVDVDGTPRRLKTLANALRAGGLQLAKDALEAGDIKQLCDVELTTDPSRSLKKVGSTTLSGVATLRALRPKQPSANQTHRPAISGEQAETLTLLLQQLRIISELLSLEASKMDDPALERLLGVLDEDLRNVGSHVATRVAPPVEVVAEGEALPPR